jgi:hypothetical protein
VLSQPSWYAHRDAELTQGTAKKALIEQVIEQLKILASA